MTFSFSGTDTGGVDIDHFECSIDNSDFVTCMTPVHFSNLEDGTHILQMRSQDNVGNVGPSPASFTWTVDTIPPATSINSATDGNKSAVTNGGTTKSTSMTFTFSVLIPEEWITLNAVWIIPTLQCVLALSNSLLSTWMMVPIRLGYCQKITQQTKIRLLKHLRGL